MLCLLLLSITLTSIINAKSASGNNILVVLDDENLRNSHSLFFQDLAGRGFTLSFSAGDDSNLRLSEYGSFLYDHLIIFASDFRILKSSMILEFIDAGHNVFMASDHFGGDAIELATECGIKVSDSNLVFDHFNEYEVTKAEKAIAISTNNLLSNSLVSGSIKKELQILYKGTSQKITQSNDLNFAILKGNPTAYSGVPYTQVIDAKGSGSDLTLISALQARNQARVIFSGSSSMFSNRYFYLPNFVNRQLANEITKWVFQERGVLKVLNVLISGQTEGSQFNFNDILNYSAYIEEWNGSNWIPFQSSQVQLEFFMLDPLIRTNLQAKGGKFTTNFHVPDVPGVFSCNLRLRELGYTILDVKNTTSVRPFRHGQSPQFLQAAYPYYSSCLSIVGVTVFFSFLFLFSK